MAIRIRTVNNTMVALCAARSVAKDGDIYIDDNAHYALMIKFRRDLVQTDGLPLPYPDAEDHAIIDAEESSNVNRSWWDAVWGDGEQPVGDESE